jgi:hypothetical protein
MEVDQSRAQKARPDLQANQSSRLYSVVVAAKAGRFRMEAGRISGPEGTWR